MMAGQFSEAAAFAKGSLDQSEKTIRFNTEEVVASLNKLGEAYRLQGSPYLAMPYYQQALTICEETLGPDHPSTATSLTGMGNVHKELAQHDKALDLIQRGLVIREHALGLNHPDTAASLTSLALVYTSLAQYDKVLPLQNRALAIFENSFGSDHPLTALGLLNIASTYSVLGLHEKALPLRERALTIGEKMLGPNHPGIAWALNSLAATLSALDQYEKASSVLERGLAIREKVFGAGHPYTAFSLHSLGDAFLMQGQYDKSLPLLERALAIREKVSGPDHPDTAISLVRLADAHLALGQHDRALALQERALAIREKVFGPDHPVTAGSLERIANIFLVRQQFNKAKSLQEQSLTILEKVLGPDHEDVAASLDGLAASYLFNQNYETALSLQERSLLIREKAVGKNNTATAASLFGLALTYASIHQHDKAISLLERALKIFASSLGPDHPQAAHTLHFLGSLYEKSGQPGPAITFQKSAINVYQSQRTRVAVINDEALTSYTKTLESHYQELADLLVSQGRLSEAQDVLEMLKESEHFDFIRRSSSADPRQTRVGLSATEQHWMSRYRAISDQLAKMGAEDQALKKLVPLGLSSEQRQRQKALAEDLRISEKAFMAFLNEIRGNFALKGPARAVEFAETSRANLHRSQRLLSKLGGDVALLQYYVTEDKVSMLLTMPNIQIARSSQMNSRDLNRQIAAFGRQLKDPKSDPLQLAQSLYKTLLGPVESDLVQADIKTVMLSLDGSLRYLPFSALHDGQQYALERWRLPLYTSVTREKITDLVKPIWQAAAMGVTKKHGEFDPLPAVRYEIGSIVRSPVLKEKNAPLNGVLPGEAYMDEAFNAHSFREVSQRHFDLMHIASHFRFSPGTEVNSFLLLGDGQRLTLGDIRTQNYRFDSVDLLTLSACDTGLGGGRDEKGREIEGFGVIAQQQGAKAVLATLWRVADKSTSTLMVDMYRRRQVLKLSKIEALRQAQLALRKQARHSHPFYWAPFILMGNWM